MSEDDKDFSTHGTMADLEPQTSYEQCEEKENIVAK